MEDEAKTVADYKIVENGFIVMMVAKVSPLFLSEEIESMNFSSSIKVFFFHSATMLHNIFSLPAPLRIKASNFEQVQNIL